MLGKILTSFIIIFFVITAVFNIFIKDDRFILLSESFLQGKTYFLQEPISGWVDTVEKDGKYFWPSGPFPIVILVPYTLIFNVFSLTFYQGYLQILLVLGVFFLVKKVAEKLGYTHSDPLFLAYGFSFSTVFMNVAFWPEAWGFTQVLAVFLLWALIFVYLEKLPWWLIGIGIGMLVATRATTLGAVLFFGGLVIMGKSKLKIKTRKILMVFLPLTISLLLIGYYNHIRFGNIFESGYTQQALSIPGAEKAREYGVLSLHHIPGNLYHFLLSGPVPLYKDGISHVLKFPFVVANPWGMSIFVTSPVFFYLFVTFLKDKLSKLVIITVLAITIPLFIYYGLGVRQYGYRYSLDFLPFLYFLLMRNYRLKFGALSNGFKLLILLTALSNFYFFLTAYLI